MKKRISLLAVVALSAITLMGCGNLFTTSTTALSGKSYRGLHHNTLYDLSFSSNRNTVIITEGISSSMGSYTLANEELTVSSFESTVKMIYDTEKDCIYFDGSTLHLK